MIQSLVVKKAGVLPETVKVWPVALAALVAVGRILRSLLAPVVVTVQMAVRQQGVLVELGRVLLPENLEKLQETYIAAVAAALQSLLLEQELLLVEMAVVHQEENQPPIILAAVAAAMMATAALASLLSASIRRRQHEIRNRN